MYTSQANNEDDGMITYDAHVLTAKNRDKLSQKSAVRPGFVYG